MNKKVIKSLADLLKLDVEVLTKGLEAEGEADFKLPEGLKVYGPDDKVFTQEQVDTIKDNHGKTRYDAGKLAGEEMLLKDAAKELGIDESINKMDKFMEAYKGKVLEEAKLKPDQKVAQLEESLENLRNKLTDEQRKYSDLESQMDSQKRDLTIQSLIPEIPENIGISKSEAAMMYKMGREFKEDGIYQNGKRIVDETETPLTMEADIKKWVSAKGWGEPPSGRGGGSGGTGSGGSTKPKTMQEFESHLKEKGINPGSSEAAALLAEIAKETPEILD